MNLIWLMRLKRWVQHPPSPRRAWLILAIIALCLLLVAIERWVGWPAFLTLEPAGRGRLPMLR
ncbi:MAG: hypothetical protein WD046_03880 [Paracoccaceae bacterium]